MNATTDQELDRQLALAEDQVLNRAMLQDGLIDIFCGACLVVAGGLFWLGQGAFAGIGFAVGLPVVVRLREQLVERRMGHVELKASTLTRKKHMVMALFGMTLLLGLAVALASDAGLAAQWIERARNLGSLVPGIVFASVASGIGFIYRAPRAHAYAMAIMAIFICLSLSSPNPSLTRHGVPLAMAAAGMAPLLTGAFLLRRFLLRHPVHPMPKSL